MSVTISHYSTDYKKYLGPDYFLNYQEIEQTSTIVSNHVSWLDAIVMIWAMQPAFAASYEFSSLPLVHALIDALDSIYIKRGGSDEDKEFALK